MHVNNDVGVWVNAKFLFDRINLVSGHPFDRLNR